MKICTNCGKELADNAVFCDGCGAKLVENSVTTKEKTPALTIAGFVVSICSWIIDFYGLVAITGIVLSTVGLSQSKKGKGLAIAGIVLGGIEAILKCIQLLALAGII